MYLALTDAGAQRSCEGDGAWNQGSGRVWGKDTFVACFWRRWCQEAAPVRVAEPEETAPPQTAGPTPPAGPQLPVPSPRERSKSPRTPRQSQIFETDLFVRMFWCQSLWRKKWRELKLTEISTQSCRSSSQWTWKLNCFGEKSTGWDGKRYGTHLNLSILLCFGLRDCPGSCASLCAVQAGWWLTMSGTTDFQLSLDPNSEDLLVDFWCPFAHNTNAFTNQISYK